MPTYAYACKECSHAFETVQSFSENSLTECPECHGMLRKKFNSVGVVFKGSGFYRTDSRSSSTSTAPAASTASSADGSSSGSASSGAQATTGGTSTSQKASTGS